MRFAPSTSRRALLALLAAVPGTALAQSDPPAAADAPEPSEAPPAAAPEPTPRATPAQDSRLTERTTGRPDARVTVIEFFSLTCGHCAAFHRTVWPQVKQELVEKGEVRMVWRDFPLDQIGLTAAMVARSLPPERYEPFVSALFASQDRWAYARDPIEELGKLALLAGLSRQKFEQLRTDQDFMRAVMETRLAGQNEFRVEVTPTFVFGKRTHSGNLPYERFRSLVEEARRA